MKLTGGETDSAPPSCKLLLVLSCRPKLGRCQSGVSQSQTQKSDDGTMALAPGGMNHKPEADFLDCREVDNA